MTLMICPKKLEETVLEKTKAETDLEPSLVHGMITQEMKLVNLPSDRLKKLKLLKKTQIGLIFQRLR